MLGFCVDVEGEDGAVEMACADVDSVGGCGDADNVAVVGVEGVGLVVVGCTDSYFSLGNSEEDIMRSSLGPYHTSNRTRLQELITNRLPLLPLRAQLIHIHNIVTLSNSQSITLRRERHGAHHIRLLPLSSSC